MATYTQSQIDALRRAYARGVTRVAYGDKTVEYRSLDDMKRLIVEMQDDLAGSANRLRRVYVTTQSHKGL
jgi:hypothetical protein